jgi:hypothetical protein
MQPTKIRFTCFPRTEPPPQFATDIAFIFQKYEGQIGTLHLKKGKTSNEVLTILREELIAIGFEVESGKQKQDKISRPVFFGENGLPTLRYEIDAYQPEWHCGLEIEAGRAWMGNAIYRDLVQGLVMVQVDILFLAVPNGYKYLSGGRPVISNDYDKTISVAESLYGHSRFHFPYRLIIIGY